MPTKVYSHSFTVEGMGYFPVDMLRYDACFPKDSDSAASILMTERDSDHFSTTRRRIYLASYRLKTWTPTIARWASFGWHAYGHAVNQAIND